MGRRARESRSPRESSSSEDRLSECRGERGAGSSSGIRGIRSKTLGPSESQLRALLRKRLDELQQMSLKMRSTSVLFNGSSELEDEVRRIATALHRLERELRRLQRKGDKEKHD